jgi:hypothetical protein
MTERLCRESIDQEETFIKATQSPILMQALARAFSAPGVLKQMAATVNDELTDEQLNLFQRAMGQLEAKASGAAEKTRNSPRNRRP